MTSTSTFTQLLSSDNAHNDQCETYTCIYIYTHRSVGSSSSNLVFYAQSTIAVISGRRSVGVQHNYTCIYIDIHRSVGVQHIPVFIYRLRNVHPIRRNYIVNSHINST